MHYPMDFAIERRDQGGTLLGDREIDLDRLVRQIEIACNASRLAPRRCGSRPLTINWRPSARSSARWPGPGRNWRR